MGFWTYALRRTLFLGLVFVLLIYVYALILDGQLEVYERGTLRWTAAQIVQGMLSTGDVLPTEVPAVRDEVYGMLIAAHGFDKPLPIRAGLRMWRVLQLDFGVSRGFETIRKTNTPRDQEVMAIIGEAMFPTAIVFGIAFIFQMVLGLLLGLRNGHRIGTRLDRASSMLAIVNMSIPPFLLAMLSVLVFVFLLPVFSSEPWVYRFPDTLGQFLPWFSNLVGHIVLPIAVLVVSSLFGTALIVRNIVLGISSEDFIMSAHARGLPHRKVMYGHTLRAASPPIATMASTGFVMALGGSFLVEPIFQWPGMGMLFLGGAKQGDAALLMGLLVVVTGMYQICLLVLDLTYGVLDPRIKVGRTQNG